jgi:hypothetical protein
MPSKLEGKWTLKSLLEITYRHFRSRVIYMKRDVIKSSIRIQEVRVFDGKNPGEARTKYIIKTASYPQYSPYYTGKDKRGRSIKFQRTYKHEYDTTFQLDTLSINAPVKYRCGANRKWQENVSKSKLRSKSNPKGKYLSVGDYNIVKKGINPDFYFRVEYIAHIEGCLFGKPYAIGMPDKKTNKYGIPFLSKHAVWIVKTLLAKGILKDTSIGV